MARDDSTEQWRQGGGQRSGGAGQPHGDGDWQGWSPSGVIGRDARHDRVDRGPTPPPSREEYARADFIEGHDMDFGGRDTAAWYARHGSHQDDMRARREQQARLAARGGPFADEGDDDHRNTDDEIDRDYHLRRGARGGQYAAAAVHGHPRQAFDDGASAAGVAPTWGSSPTRQADDHRGKGPRHVRRPDQRIREDLCERLTEDPAVDARDIEVDCRDGVVVLSGEVETRREKHRAEDVADHCPGVVDIDNRLKVRRVGTARIGHWP
jgi:osmotically-inducible protein OsmY